MPHLCGLADELDDGGGLTRARWAVDEADILRLQPTLNSGPLAVVQAFVEPCGDRR